jgi:hypothetical protein
MGQESSDFLIKRDYDLNATILYGDKPKLIGCVSCFDVESQTDLLEKKKYKKNIWDTFEAISKVL